MTDKNGTTSMATTLDQPITVLARDIMMHDVLTVGPETLVSHAVSLLVQHGIGGLPVADGVGRLLGIVTDYALLTLLYQPELGTAEVSTLMTESVISVDERMAVSEVAETLVKHRIRRVPVVRNDKVVGIISREDVIRYTHASAEKAARGASPILPGMSNRGRADLARLLVVDDSPVIHVVVQNALSNPGYKLDFVDSGEEALARIDKEPPDLILLDRVMPGLDGLAVLKRLHDCPRTTLIPVIMVTACGQPTHVAEAFAAGAVDFVNKPFSDIELQARVASALRTHWLQCDLDKERAKAEKATHAKSEFLARMSHELRTPMNSIIGFTNRLLRKQLDDKISERDLESLGIVDRNAKNLLKLIGDILDLSKIEAGMMAMTKSHFNLTDVVQEVVSRTASLTDSKPIEVITQLPESPLDIAADRGKISQVIANLMSNAINYTDRGTVTIVVDRAEDETLGPIARVSVCDTGIGIRPEDREQLFGMFTQVNGDMSRPADGTGLGLYIVQQFVDMHGGRVEVESELGKGSRFSLLLPLGPTIDPTDESELELCPVY